MKFSAALVVLASSAFAAEFSASQYAEGEVHQQLMDMKNVRRSIDSHFKSQSANVLNRHTGMKKQPRVSSIQLGTHR
jgi:hypothetical protein